MRKEFEQLALLAGGSHYPQVGGNNLELFGKLLVENCVEVVGARFNGSASLSKAIFITALAFFASDELAFLVIAITWFPQPLAIVTKAFTSTVSPEFEIAIKTSPGVRAPESP